MGQTEDLINDEKMKLILENPFCVLGLFANSPERDLVKNSSLLRKYQKIGRQKTFPLDLACPSEICRDAEELLQASAKIEHTRDRISYGIFWFFNSNHVDEVAFNHIKSGNTEKAVEIWTTYISGKELSEKNISVVANLSTLKLIGILAHEDFDEEEFAKWICKKAEILCSDEFDLLIESTSADPVLIDRETLLLRFIDDVYELSKNAEKGNAEKKGLKFIRYFEDTPNDVRQLAVEKVTSRIVTSIEREVEKCRQLREKESFESDKYGQELFDKTFQDLEYLKRALEEGSLKYQMLCDQVANEVVQCAIDLFNEWVESRDWDPGETALELLHQAKRLKLSQSVENWLEENLEVIEKFVDGAPQRRKLEKVENEISFITTRLESFKDESGVSNIAEAKKLITDCAPKLRLILIELGRENHFYIDLSSALVFEVMQVGISVVNVNMKLLESFDLTSKNTYILRNNRILSVTECRSKTVHSVTECTSLLHSLTGFDIYPELREALDKNFLDLKSFYRQPKGYSATAKTKPRLKPVKKSITQEVSVDGIFEFNEQPPFFSSLIPTISSSRAKIGLVAGVIVIGIIIYFSVTDLSTGLTSSKSKSTQTPIVSTNTTAEVDDAKPRPINEIPSPTKTPIKTSRPTTGSNISSINKGGGRGSLKISNGSDDDAIAKLVDTKTGKAFREVYIRRKGDFNITGIRPGKYELMFSQGGNYSPELKKFTEGVKFQKFDNYLDFTVQRTGGGVQWSYFEVTLTAVPYGNASTSQISEEDFKNN